MPSKNLKKRSLKDILRPEEIMGWIKSNFQYKVGNNGWVKICNPFQAKESGTADNKFHLNINIKTGTVHDWRPDWQHTDGHVIKFVQNYFGCSFNDAIKKIKDCEAVDVGSEDEFVKPSVSHIELPQSFEFDGTQKIEQMAVNYLKSRGISKQTALLWGIRYGVGTIIFPYIEYDEIVYWQSREIANKKFAFPPSSTGVTKTQFLYGWHMVEPGDDVYITESLFGAVSIGPGGLASGGATLSKRQVDKLNIISPDRIILCPDSDNAGLASIVSNFNLFSAYNKDKLWYCVPPNPIKDWNDYIQTEGSAKEFIDRNILKLNISAVMEISKKLQKSKNINNFRKGIV